MASNTLLRGKNDGPSINEEVSSDDTPLLYNDNINKSNDNKLAKSTDVTLVALLCAMAPLFSSFQFGLAVTVTSPLARTSVNGSSDGTVLMNNKTEGGLGLDTSQSNLFASMLTLGAMVGGLLGTGLLGYAGRRVGLFLCGVCYVVGGVMQALATEFLMLISGRFFVGLGLGLGTMAAPSYIAEVCPPSIRGALGTMHQLLVVTGAVVGCSFGLYWEGDWRRISWANVPAPVAMCLACFAIPKSPRYLAGQGKLEEAKRVLLVLRGGDIHRVESEMQEIKQNNSSTRVSKDGSKGNSSSFRAIVLLLFLMFFQQSSGINGIVFNCAAIFQQAGLHDANLGATIAMCVQLVFTAIAVTLVDKVGRRVLIITSGLVLFAATFLLGFYFFSLNNAHTKPLSPIFALLMVGIFYGGFAIGFGPLPWLLMSELAPMEYRGLATGLCTVINWTVAFLVTFFFPSIADTLGDDWAFWIFSICAFCGVFFVVFFIPETKGQSLEKIEAYFRGEEKLEGTNRSENVFVGVFAFVVIAAVVAVVITSIKF
eukprot:m.68724 g.68724  ORF g.68724 m.68724 type:complete len:540 (+) comp11994_c0_seq1:270-1889(+)